MNLNRCTAEIGECGAEVRCQEPKGHEGNHMHKRYVGSNLVPNIFAWGPEKPTVEITVEDLQLILKPQEQCAPMEAAARVGALRRAQQLIDEAS